MSRRFFQAGIDQLEALFRESASNVSLLRELNEELAYRTTNKARKLREAVQARLRTTHTAPPPRESRGAEHQSTPEEAEPTNGASTSDDAKSRTRGGTAGAPPPRQRRPAGPLPPVTNEPAKILDAWTALEVLSPPPFNRPESLAGGDRRAVAPLDQRTLPWEGDGEKSRPNCRLYYQVVLGTIRMAPALNALIEQFGDQRPERPAARGEAILAIVMLDKKGRLVESPSVTISSLGWGVMAALEGELADLARWPSAEADLVHRIDAQIRALCTSDQNSEEQVLRPVSRSILLSVFRTLVDELRLPSEFVEAPRFAIRSYEYFKNQNPPEPLLLNSFFLRDLASARQLVSENKAPANLYKFLGKTAPPERLDLLESRSALEKISAPAKTPLARWPGANRHPLVLLQQAAVNAAFSETDNGGLLGINGPPGTGKTTLLRDVLAGVVTLRAEAMAKFDDPQDAFAHSGEKLKAGNGWLHLYRLDPALRGFEMLVASSNNRAVENVSAEVPALSAIAADAGKLRYFKTLSDALHRNETWGLIAAVLGNAERRGRFRRAFWWDDDVGFNTYLAAAAGSVDDIEVKDPETGATLRRPPRIVTDEQPPSTHDIALHRWRVARREFAEAADKARVWQKWLEAIS